MARHTGYACRLLLEMCPLKHLHCVLVSPTDHRATAGAIASMLMAVFAVPLNWVLIYTLGELYSLAWLAQP